MPALRFTRDRAPKPSDVFIITKYGVVDGFDFDRFGTDILEDNVLKPLNLKMRRLSQPNAETGMWNALCQLLQEARLVIIDWTTTAGNLPLEFGLALAYGKRVIGICQDPKDIPSDVSNSERYIRYPRALEFRAVNEFTKELREQIKLMLEAPSTELGPTPYGRRAPEPASATVKSVNETHAVVETNTGIAAVVNGKEIDWNRVYPDLRKRLKEGDRVEGAFVYDNDRQDRPPKFTLLNYSDGDPWIQIQAMYESNEIIRGAVVARVTPGVGAFVRIYQNINGLISQRRAAGLEEGNRVDVTITALNVVERKIQLAAITDHPGGTKRDPLQGEPPHPRVGFKGRGNIVRVKPVGADGRSGGYVLVQLEDYPQPSRPVLLLRTKMLSDTKADFDANELEPADPKNGLDGDIVYCQVIKVQDNGAKILIEELEDDQLDGGDHG